MALPTKNLPFEYTQRWTEVGPLLVPTATAETLNLLNKRDKDLEDYLANLGDGGGGCSEAFSASQTYPDTLVGAGSSTNLTLNSYKPLDFYTGGCNDLAALPTGLWQVNIRFVLFPDAYPVTGDIALDWDVNYGRVTDQMLLDGLVVDTGPISIDASGVVYMDEAWGISVDFINSTDQDIYAFALHFSAVQSTACVVPTLEP